MWRRDAAVHEMIRALDEYPRTIRNWDDMSNNERLAQLTKSEWEAVQEQYALCGNDFTFAARNYFWITDNSGQDVLLTLWEAQYLILQLYYDLKSQGKPQKIYIIKGRQIGASLLIEAMIAWTTIFTPNTEALVVSVDQSHASYLFSLMLHIYDRLPWWLKPELASREENDGLWFDNKDPEKRATEPGMSSRIYVQWSTQFSGVGQGRKILAAHISELTDWHQARARKIIEGDLLHAIKETPRAFGFLETTGKEAGSYSHRLWRSCEKLAEESEWYPLFLPWFFESSRRRVVPVNGWRPQKQELSMRARVSKEWVKCLSCSRHLAASIRGRSRDGDLCPFCKHGILKPVVLADDQLYWKEVKRKNAEEKGQESLNEHKIELCSTAEESFQLQGLAVFGSQCQEAVNATILDPDKVPGVKVGYFDTKGRFHGIDGNRPIQGYDSMFGCYCLECQYDHTADLDQFNVTIWEDSEPGNAYVVGVDIAEGIGQDFSVIFVNRIGKGCNPDVQVLTLRDNRMEPMDLAFYCNHIGLRYNDALMCIEYNGIGKVCADTVLRVYNYPNVYQWKQLDSRNPVTNKWHWYTKADTREKLWQTARKWIKAGSWVIRSKNFLAEMQMFQKDEDDSKSAGHADGEHDDELFAGMISLYCAHEGSSDDRGVIHVPVVEDKNDNPRYLMHCHTCGYEWGANNPEYNFQCPADGCYSIQVTGKSLEIHDNRAVVDMGLLGGPPASQADIPLSQSSL